MCIGGRFSIDNNTMLVSTQQTEQSRVISILCTAGNGKRKLIFDSESVVLNGILSSCYVQMIRNTLFEFSYAIRSMVELLQRYLYLLLSISV
jgi:hypothetical protein